MSTSLQNQKYNLQQANAILFAGFHYVIPDETINAFNFLSAQIGSNAFINNNVFQKREPEKGKEGDRDDLDQGYKLDKRRKKDVENAMLMNEITEMLIKAKKGKTLDITSLVEMG